MDPKDSKETSTKVEPDAAKGTDTQNNSRSRQTRSGGSSKKPGITATMSAPRSQPRFLGIFEGMNGKIFDIVPTQANRYIKTKKDLVGYVGRTYSNLTKNLIETLTYKLASIVGPVMPTKQVTKPINNVVTAVNKLETDLTYLKKLDINEETRSYKKDKHKYKKDMLKVYDIIHSQCTDAMIQELQTYSSYEAVFGASDHVELL